MPGAAQPPLVVHIIHSLGTGGLENGLVNIINRTPPDRYRHAIVCLTEAGYELFRSVAVPHSTSIAKEMAALTPDELAALTALTDKLRRSIEG